MKTKQVSKYGGRAKDRQPTPAVAMDLSGPEGRRILMSAVERVISTHSKVIKALANR